MGDQIRPASRSGSRRSRKKTKILRWGRRSVGAVWASTRRSVP